MIKLKNINKYKQNCDDVTCHLELEIYVDIYIDVKINSETTRFWTRGRIQYEHVKCSKCVRLPDSGASWIVVSSLPS